MVNQNNTNESDTLEYPAMPVELEYLIEPGIRYGRAYHFDNDVDWFLENAEESDFDHLATLAERARLAGDYPRLIQWMREISNVSERKIELHFLESNLSGSDLSKAKIKFELQKLGEVNDKLHDMDIYFLWFDGCLRYEIRITILVECQGT